MIQKAKSIQIVAGETTHGDVRTQINAAIDTINSNFVPADKLTDGYMTAEHVKKLEAAGQLSAEVTAALGNKAEKSEVVTLTQQTTTALAQKADIATVNSALAQKADIATVNSALAQKADEASVVARFASQGEAISKKADNVAVQQQLSNKANMALVADLGRQISVLEQQHRVMSEVEYEALPKKEEGVIYMTYEV